MVDTVYGRYMVDIWEIYGRYIFLSIVFMEFISQQTNISLGRQMVITLIRCALSM